MGAATFPVTLGRRESLRGSVLASIGLHVALAAGVIGYAGVNWRHSPGWGNPWGKGSSARVNVVTSLPGVPLPAPMRATPNTLATQNPGLYQTPPKPKPETPPKAEPIPKFQDAIKPEKPLRINKRIQKEQLTPPPNAIPYGAGGRPSMSYGQIVNQEGEGAIGFGEGNFGEQYGWYVDAARNRISSNWLMATVSPTITSARRVYVQFDVQRDGTITNVKLTQSSGVAEVDRSALRAVEASNPLGPLPPGYSGSKVSVDFYFDFQR